jgi:heme-degrading monooxygenase HmoA
VIARLWHGWTSPENADGYEALLRGEVLPRLERIDGYRGAYLLRRFSGEGIEFTTVTLWASMDAVGAFAGEDVKAAVVPPEAQRLLSRFDERSVHYDVVLEPADTG